MHHQELPIPRQSDLQNSKEVLKGRYRTPNTFSQAHLPFSETGRHLLCISHNVYQSTMQSYSSARAGGDVSDLMHSNPELCIGRGRQKALTHLCSKSASRGTIVGRCHVEALYKCAALIRKEHPHRPPAIPRIRQAHNQHSAICGEACTSKL